MFGCLDAEKKMLFCDRREAEEEIVEKGI